jgi:hypothetical protein
MESPNFQSESSGIKYIRTANGAKLKDNFDQNSLILPYEHICQNLCDYLIKKTPNQDKHFFKEDEDISLKNISDISINIFSSLKNLYLDSDPTKAADELFLLKDYKCNIILDATTKSNGQNPKNLREISKLSNLDILFGYTLKNDYFRENAILNNIEKIHNEIRYELVYGYDDLIPSFLGEMIISDSQTFPNKNEAALFEILFKVVEEFSIPLFIKLNYTSASGNNIFEFFDKKISNLKIDKKLLVFIFTKDIVTDEEIKFIQKEILGRGFTLILGIYDCDLVLANKKINNQETNLDEFTLNSNILSPYFSKEKLNFFTQLILTENKKFIDQIMISNNINFRIQLKKYGGFGYCNLFRNYYDKIVQGCNLSDEENRKIFNQNLLNLMAWWEPPKKNEKKVKMITCSNCQKEKEESEDIFRKFEFVYCTVKCLREHANKK